MNKPRKRAPGGGRKPAAESRPINRNRSFYLYADQVEQVTPDFVRRAVDEKLNDNLKTDSNELETRI